MRSNAEIKALAEDTELEAGESTTAVNEVVAWVGVQGEALNTALSQAASAEDREAMAAPLERAKIANDNIQDVLRKLVAPVTPSARKRK